MQGRSDEAVECFMNMANDENLAWLGLANAALVRARQGEQETALHVVEIETGEADFQLNQRNNLANDRRPEMY